MPRKTEIYDLEAEHARIDTELDDLADEVADLDEDNPLYDQKVEEAAALERQLAGLSWALYPDEDDDHDPYEEITLGALSAGEYADVRDTLAGESDETKGDAGVTGILLAARGIVDAPFIEQDDPSFDEKIGAVSSLAPHFQDWISTRVDDLSTPDIEGNAFAQRLAEREASAKTPK